MAYAKLSSTCLGRSILAGACLGVLWPAVGHAQMGLPYLAEPDDDSWKEPAAPAPAAAKPTPPPAPAATPEAPAAAEPMATAAGPSGGVSPSHVYGLWHKRRAALTQQNQGEAQRLLQEIIEAREQAGWPNIFVLGQALARESTRAAAQGNIGEAERLGEAAVALAPHLPATHIALARAAWRKHAFTAAIGSYVRAYLLTWTEPPLFWGRMTTIWLAMMIAALFACACFAALVVYRHGRLLVHDLHHLLPRGATRVQGALFGVAALLAPVFFRLGVTWTLLVWILLLGLYYERRERIGATVALAVLAAIALLLPPALSYFAYPGSREEAAYLAARDLDSEAAAERLAGLNDLDGDEMLILGMRANWTGELERAVAWLRRAQELGYADAALLTSLGNLEYRLGRAREAIDFYEKAVAVDSDAAVAYFNMSRIYHQLTEGKKGGEAHRRAFDIDYDRVERMDRLAKRMGQGYVVPAELPDAVVRQGLSGSPEAERAARQVWRWIGGRVLDRVHFAAAALGGIVLIVLLALARRALRPSAGCGRCGAAACRRCNPEMSDQAVCGQCHHAFVAQDGVDPQARVKKEIEVHRYQARTAQVRRVLSLLLVGTGPILAGQPLVGMGLLLLYTSALIGVLCAIDVLPCPALDLQHTWVVSLVLASLLGLATYVVGTWHAQRTERR